MKLKECVTFALDTVSFARDLFVVFGLCVIGAGLDVHGALVNIVVGVKDAGERAIVFDLTVGGG
jgi:hypothetical protein